MALTVRHGFDPLTIMPVKYSRVRRLRFLGRRFFRSAFMRGSMRRARGKRTLVMIARRQEQSREPPNAATL